MSLHTFHIYCVLAETMSSRMSKDDFMWELYTQEADQSLVALHAYAPDDRLSKAGASRRRMPAGRGTFCISTSACRFIPRLTSEGIDYLIEAIRSLA